jgi:hypothetical protein
MQKGVILGCGNRSNAGMDTVTLGDRLMAFVGLKRVWISTNIVYKFSSTKQTLVPKHKVLPHKCFGGWVLLVVGL